jgi:lysophospholipase L1-like esterase
MKRMMQRVLMVLSLLACGFMIAGLVMALNPNLGTKLDEKKEGDVQMTTQPTINPAENGLKLVALGDSLTRGAGDEGNLGGYVGRVADSLAKEWPELRLDNLAIDGYTAVDLITLLNTADTGNRLRNADAILLSIGGNDLFQGGNTLLNLEEEYVSRINLEYVSRLREILAIIRASNPTTPIYMLGLYDPFRQLETGAETSRYIRSWNDSVAELLEKDGRAVLIPTYDLNQLSSPTFLADDQFHPSATGYDAIAARVLPNIQALFGGEQR